MSAIAWAMWAYWWRAVLGPAVVAERGPARAAPTDQCTSCLRFGHVAANCPDEAWRLR
ncbi:hypothetical protein [Pseudorhodoferax sp. Leaf265]|uniref:hypothetical protein n=1 Tax=Pseudorhodoferax sp. Leaf265 TaxID=1736315 RepID=UPI0012E9372C|nr:hypothetical protein [Pseudorhodoferax sp. Leaf265]